MSIKSKSEVFDGPIEIRPVGEGEFQVWLKVGVQSFSIGVPASHEDTLWYANQLSIALEKYVNERTTNRHQSLQK